MISFMLRMVSVETVVAAALAGLVVGMLVHLFFGDCCKKSACCCNGECKEGEGKQGCCSGHAEQHKAHHGGEKKRDCGMGCILWHKIGWFIIYFAQAYGLAFVLERLNLLGNFRDAIAMALFVGVVFVISGCFAQVLHRRSSFMHYILKSIYKLFVLAVMACVIAYFAGMVMMPMVA